MRASVYATKVLYCDFCDEEVHQCSACRDPEPFVQGIMMECSDGNGHICIACANAYEQEA